jgi:hypothetical protein
MSEAQQFKAFVVEKAIYVAPRSGEEIIDAPNLVPAGHKPLAQMRSDNPAAP